MQRTAMICAYMDETEREAVPRANASGTLARLIILTFSGERGARSFSDLFREFVQCYQALSNESPVPLWRPANDRAAAAAMADVLADRMKSGELTPAPLRLAARFAFRHWKDSSGRCGTGHFHARKRRASCP